jgi:hypothetical protein
MERDLSGERMFINPPWELAEQISRHFESSARTSPTSTMIVFVLPKWAKFNELNRHWKIYQEFSARTQPFTRQSLDDPTKQEVVAPTPWLVQLWFVDADCAFYDSAPTTLPDEPTSVHVPPDVPEESIATLRQFPPESYRLVNGPHRSSAADSNKADFENS